MSFQNAVEALTSHTIDTSNVLIPSTVKTSQRAAQPPQRANDEKRVIAYLCKRRGLDSSIVFSLINSGKLWQDTHGNCNFQICDWQEQSIGAEIVGTGDTRYKQTTAHSGYGFHLICGDKPDTAMYFESAIDLLSCYQLYRSKLTHHILVSMGGLNNSIIEELSKVRPQLTHWLCVDNDPAGDNFISDMQQTMPVKVFRTSSGKDWNEYLIDLKTEI
ncbi:MAG: toprim domain-containing protein [Lachnospiraceae bacterium]